MVSNTVLRPDGETSTILFRYFFTTEKPFASEIRAALSSALRNALFNTFKLSGSFFVLSVIIIPIIVAILSISTCDTNEMYLLYNIYTSEQ
jgi:hypothetical protein